jgi:hypothetical protein
MQKSLLPVLIRMSGLQAYYLVEVADNQIAAISIFETRADAKAGAGPLATWIAQQSSLVVRDFSEAMGGLTTPIVGPAPWKMPIN